MIDGLVLYTDGSFRDNTAGWGIHGYTYVKEAPKAKVNLKLQPTINGYQDVPALEACTVVKYIDSFGRVLGKVTNNIAELKAAINAIKLAIELKPKELLLFIDSEYVLKGMNKYVTKWISNGWLGSKGQPIANKEIWIELNDLLVTWKATGNKLTTRWIKGHSDNLGNDNADRNALRGLCQETEEPVFAKVQGVVVNTLKRKATNPLILESRMLFSVSKDRVKDKCYYFYDLAKNHNAGHRPKDTKKEKIIKSDLLLGRRISEATFSIYEAVEEEDYLETLIDLHVNEYGSDLGQLGIIHLANAAGATNRHQIESLGIDGLIKIPEAEVLATPDLGLISRTLNPPRLANEAIGVFKTLKRRLSEYKLGTLGDKIKRVDITDLLYDKVTKGNKTSKQLKKTITSNTRFIEVDTEYLGKNLTLKVVLTVDIISRNQLAKLNDENVKVEVLIDPVGPRAYSFSTVIVSDDGIALYSNPYTQFILI